MTTISLLLLAGIKAVNDGLLEISNESRKDEAYDLFLNAKYCNSERKIKLVPIENDRFAYDKIFNGEDDLDEDSKITRNFRHFYDKLTRKPQQLTFDNLLDAVEHLQIISIELDADDDAQLIFESLNSTGLALTEADKIRNYLLMSLTAEEQQLCFKNYWQKIESATENNPTKFLRDYLTIKQQLQRPVRLSNIYFEWKKYMDGRDRKQDNVFFIQFLKYAATNNLSNDEIDKVIDVVENYLARRIICNMPGNALTQVFCALHKDVLKSIVEYQSAGVPLTCSYSDILAYHIMRRDGNYQLPRDVQFVTAIQTRDVYHMLKPYQIFLFERLENSVPGEYNDVAADMKKKDATIEHIMPQTLNGEWKNMLGDNYEEIQEKYLHTFANLTLTGINSELSNKAFEIKRDGKNNGDVVCPGYKDSKYRLTKLVTTCEKWREEELQKRSEEIVKTFLRLYPLPKPTFKPLTKPIDEVSLDEETFTPTNRVLTGFRLFGRDYTETTWKDMLLTVVKVVMEQHAYVVDSLYDKEGFFWSEKNADDRYCTKIASHKYLWTSMDNKSKLRCLRYLFDKCDIAESELVMLLEPVKE